MIRRLLALLVLSTMVLWGAASFVLPNLGKPLKPSPDLPAQAQQIESMMREALYGGNRFVAYFAADNYQDAVYYVPRNIAKIDANMDLLESMFADPGKFDAEAADASVEKISLAMAAICIEEYWEISDIPPVMQEIEKRKARIRALRSLEHHDNQELLRIAGALEEMLEKLETPPQR